MHRNAGRRGVTPLAPIPIIALVRATASRTALLSLLVLSAPGCGENSTPTPLTPTPLTPLPSPSATVTIEGRVLDELDKPVEGARITLLYSPGGPVPSSTADATGGFSLPVDWPAHWPGVMLRVDREGYESADVSVQAAEATGSVLINMYRSLTISPGESIQTTLSLHWGGCGFEPFCRRATINAPSGKLVDIEVIPADRQEYAGLAVKDQLFWGYNFPGRVTVSGGDEIWIVVRQLGPVTLRASGR